MKAVIEAIADTMTAYPNMVLMGIWSVKQPYFPAIMYNIFVPLNSLLGTRIQIGSDNLMNAFGEQIRKLRKSERLTLRGLADKSNLSYSFIGSLENGRYNPSRESIYSLAKPLGADVNELLMLAGFLPDQADAGEDLQVNSYAQSASDDAFELEDILKIPVTFQGNQLNEADKIALIAFLQTMSGIKSSQ